MNINESFIILNIYYKKLFQKENPIFDENVENAINVWAEYGCECLEECPTCPFNKVQQWIVDMNIADVSASNLCSIVDIMYEHSKKMEMIC